MKKPWKAFGVILLTGGLAVGTANATVFTGSPSPSLSPTFGTLINFDDQATGTVVGQYDYVSEGLASITETTGAGELFQRYSGTQSAPNYIGTGFGYDLGGSDSTGWDGVFLFEFASLSDMVGIGVADSRGDPDILEILDSSGGVLESTAAPSGLNTYVGFDRTAFGGDIKYLRVTCDYCALDDLQFTSKVPEPASLALLGLGLVGVGITRRKHLKK